MVAQQGKRLNKSEYSSLIGLVFEVKTKEKSTILDLVFDIYPILYIYFF